MAGQGWRASLRTLPRPLRWLGVLAGALLALLLALSLALAVATNRYLRPLVEEQATAAIPGVVSAASLSIGLFGGNVTVKGLEVRPSEPGAEAVIRIGRLHLSVARLPLLAGRVVVKLVEIDEPFVRLVREESGELDLLRIVVPETPPAPEPEAPSGGSVPVRVNAIALGEGRIEFVDRAQPGAEPLTVELPALRIDNLVVTGEPDEHPTDVHVEVRAEGARIEVEGKLHLDDDRLDVDATLDLENLPLTRARVYLPDLGWTELAGALDAKLHYVHVSGEQQVADGSATLRDLRVGVPSLESPAFALTSLAVELERLDLLGRQLALGEVQLSGLRGFFDPADPARLPLLPKGIPVAEAPAAAEEPAAPFTFRIGRLALEDAELVPLGEGQQPLRIDAALEGLASGATEPATLALSVSQEAGSVALEGRVHLEPAGFEGTLTLDELALPPLLRAVVGEEAELLSAGVAKGELRIGAGSLVAGGAPAPGGDLKVEGALQLAGIDAKRDAEGSLLAKVDEISLDALQLSVPGLLPPPAGDAAAAGWQAPADAGSLRLAGTLRVAGLGAKSGSGEPLAAELARLELQMKELEVAKLLAPAPPEGEAGVPAADAGSLRFAGALRLERVRVRSGKDGEFDLGLEAAEVGLGEIAAPGLLAAAPPGGAGRKSGPLRVALDSLRLATPKLRLTRTAKGIVLPGAPGAGPTGTPAPPAPAREAPGDEALRLTIGNVSLEDGSIRFVDRAVKPFYQGEVTALRVSARNVGFPELRAEDVSVKLDAPGPAPVWALASYTPPTSWFELNLEKLPLAPLNPYIESASGYVVDQGELSLYSKGSEASGKLAAANWITLYDPEISGGGEKSPLEAATGVPVSLAVSLLKDPAGDIGLSIPIEYDESGTSIGLTRVIGSAVTQVLIGALTSPLKLVGAVVDAGGRVKDVTPQAIGFLPGRTELAGSGIERIAALAKLLAARPSLDIALQGQTSGSDGQFVREAALVAAIESGEGLPEAAEGLGNALLRRRVRGALEARMAGEPDTADPEDLRAMEAWTEAMVVPEDAMTTLASARAAKVRGLLESEHGLDAARLTLAEPGPPGGAPEPAVGIQLDP